MRRVMPLPRGRQLAWGDHTHLMAILNVTPDSFSDGGQLLAGGLEGAVGQARRLVHEGAGVLDVGGQSTRPGALRLTAQEEAARVVPFVRLVRVVLMGGGTRGLVLHARLLIVVLCSLEKRPSCHLGRNQGCVIHRSPFCRRLLVSSVACSYFHLLSVAGPAARPIPLQHHTRILHFARQLLSNVLPAFLPTPSHSSASRLGAT